MRIKHLLFTIPLIYSSAHAENGASWNDNFKCIGSTSCPTGLVGGIDFVVEMPMSDFNTKCPAFRNEAMKLLANGKSSRDEVFHPAYIEMMYASIPHHRLQGITYDSQYRDFINNTKIEFSNSCSTPAGASSTPPKVDEVRGNTTIIPDEPLTAGSVCKSTISYSKTVLGCGTKEQGCTVQLWDGRTLIYEEKNAHSFRSVIYNGNKIIPSQQKIPDYWYSDFKMTAIAFGGAGIPSDLHPDQNPNIKICGTVAPTLIIPPIPPLTPNKPRAELCPEGHTGKIQYKWEIYYTDDTYQTTYTDGTPATVTQKTPHQREVLDFNSCKLIPTQTTQERPDVQEESCDSYFGVAPGTYTGMVQKYGTYKSVYDSALKTTTMAFVIDSIDTTSCISQFTNTGLETSTMPCPAGQTGSIELYRYKAENTLGQVIYPYGEQMIVGSNSCAGVQADTVIQQDATPPSGLLGNISITSSDLKDNERFSKYLSELSGNGWSSTQTHKLIIEIDDLQTGTFSASKIGSAISKFQTTVGSENSEIEIKLPRSIDQFVGMGGITREAVQNKSISMKSVSFDGYDARVTYWELGKGSISKPQEKEAKINIIPKGMSLKRISGE